VLCDLQPHNFIDGQTITAGNAATFIAARRRAPCCVTTVAHAHIGFVAVPRAIFATLATAFHTTAVITAIAVTTTTAQSNVTVIVFILLVDADWTVAVIRRGAGMVGRRVCIIGIAGLVKITGTTGVIVDNFEEIAVGHFHHFFYQRLVFLRIPLHFSRLLRFQILISTLNICSLRYLFCNFFPARAILNNEAKQ